MSHKRLWVVAGIIAFIIVGGFVFSVPHTRDVARISVSEGVTAVPLVTLHDVFKKGTHTITGSLLAPDACTTLTARASLQGDASSTESIQVALSMPSNAGVCLELPTRMNFSTTIIAPAQVPLSATVNGIAATTTSS
jgi:hypothetical protein